MPHFVGGTQELRDFCAKKAMLPEREIVRITAVNEAFVRMERGDVRHRFVADLAALQG